MDRNLKSKNSKEKIIKAAFSLFTTKGYDAATTQEIIGLAELSRGAMYYHFKNKEDILRCITAYFQDQTNIFLEKLAADNSLTVKEKISKLIKNSTDNYTQRKMTHRCWVEKIPFALLEELRNLNNVIAPYLAQIIKQGVENGEFKCDYPQELAEIIVISIDVWLDPVLFSRSYDEICRRLDFLMIILERMNSPIIDPEEIQHLKDLYK